MDRKGSAAGPVMLWDVDGVLNVAAEGHVPHLYDGLGPTDWPATGVVYLNPLHAQWMEELSNAGASHAWATAWGRLATRWIAPRLYPPAADWPVIDVGVHAGIRFGRSYKINPITEFLGSHRPAFWLDDLVGGKDKIWAEDRTARGVPTVVRRINSEVGLTRADVEAALGWLDEVKQP